MKNAPCMGALPAAPRGGRRFRKSERLRRRGEFLELGRRGQRIHCRFFTVVFASGRFPQSRMGLTVSRRVGGAVRRNRVKRVCREFFRQHRERLVAPMDINLIAKPAAARMTTSEAFNCLIQIFERLGTFHDGAAS